MRPADIKFIILKENTIIKEGRVRSSMTNDLYPYYLVLAYTPRRNNILSLSCLNVEKLEETNRDINLALINEI
ncbi:MAG TPA: hypothetical protein VKY57_01370 [Chitinispirillaceae bacterium]|nr:hypothetical protein [Chitinispirillaceae bacterium]